MIRISKSTTGSISAVIGGLIAATVLQLSPLRAAPETHTPKIIVQSTPINRDSKGTTSYANVIKKVAPSVVNIYSSRKISMRQMQDDPFFRRFFGDQSNEDQLHRAIPHREEGMGSGVILSADGYILTANHVVQGADEVKVDLPNGEKGVLAKVIGADPPTDIAVLKVNAEGLLSATIADSDKLEVGDVVLAIGNPFGVGQTVTMGIVSGKGRNALGIAQYEDFIQTDAPINMGNSGGALVDAEGRLVGINTAIFSMSGGNQGIGFAVPVNLARYVMDQFLGGGKVRRGYLGIGLQPDISSDLAQEFKLPSTKGAMAAEVVPDSPAAKAEFKEGDVITEFNGKKITDPSQFRLTISQTAPGTKGAFKIIRDGKERTLTATLGELSEDRMMARRGGGRGGRNRPSEREIQPQPKEDDALNGVEVTDIDQTTQRRLGISNDVKSGALVTNVDPDSESYTAGLRPGDIVTEINHQPIRTADEAVEASKKITTERVLLRVSREGGTRFLVVRNSKKK